MRRIVWANQWEQALADLAQGHHPELPLAAALRAEAQALWRDNELAARLCAMADAVTSAEAAL